MGSLDFNTSVELYLMLSLILHFVLTFPPRTKLIEPLYRHPNMVWLSIIFGPLSLLYLGKITRSEHV